MPFATGQRQPPDRSWAAPSAFCRRPQVTTTIAGAGRQRAWDLEILRLLAQGRTLPQVADTLGIGYKTAANNCSRIKAKLGAASTADLIRIAIRFGLDGDTGLPAVGVDSSSRPP